MIFRNSDMRTSHALSCDFFIPAAGSQPVGGWLPIGPSLMLADCCCLVAHLRNLTAGFTTCSTLELKTEHRHDASED
jgi:hypothetical protein